MVLSVQGLRLDQVKMDRVEEAGDFPLQIQTDGDVARLTDRQLDPGTLCPGRTVTARYRVAFAEDVTQGRVTLAAEAYDANLRLLARQTATRSVVGVGGAPTATPKPTATPPEPTESASTPTEGESTATEEPVAEYPADAAPPAANRPVSQSGAFGVVQVAFLLGGLLLFLGVGLLLRLRHLTRARVGVLPAGSMLVVRALPAAASAGHEELAEELDRCLSKVGVNNATGDVPVEAVIGG